MPSKYDALLMVEKEWIVLPLRQYQGEPVGTSATATTPGRFRWGC